MARKKSTTKQSEPLILSVGKRMFPFGSTGWGWDPLLGLESIRMTMNALYGELFHKSRTFLEEETWEPPMDMFIAQGNLVMDIALPGVQKEAITIHATTSLVVIDGRYEEEKEVKEQDIFVNERKYGRFMRSVPLPVKIHPELLRTDMKDGVVRLIFPLVEGESETQDLKKS
jgi:HSP20 family protein